MSARGGGHELVDEALVVSRNPPHTIAPTSSERVQFLKAHARDVVVAQAVLGVAQLEWEAFLVLLTASQLVATLPQGQLRRVTDATILPIGIDNVGVHWDSGAVLSSPHGMLPASASAGDWASVLAKRSLMLRSFKDLLKSGWLLFSWDFDCSRTQQALAAAAADARPDGCVLAGEGRTSGADATGGAGNMDSSGEDTRASGCLGSEGGRGSGGARWGGGGSGSGKQGRAARAMAWCEREGARRGWDMRFVWNATWLEPLLRSARYV